jgi:uncharacterized membrane protein (UPF0127 family)
MAPAGAVRRLPVVLAAALAACAPVRYAFPQDDRAPVEGTVRIGGRAVEVVAYWTRAHRERAFAGRTERDYPRAFLLMYPRERRIHLYTTGIRCGFRVWFVDLERRVVGTARLAPDDERGVTSGEEAACALVVPDAVARMARLPEEGTAEYSEEIARIVPEDLVELRIGEARLFVEVAPDAARQQRGLMYRTALSADEGMLFVYPFEDSRGFWMHNTRVPLSLAYIRADGTIGHIVARMEPMSDRLVYSRVPAQYVLEVPEGWFERHGVREGDRVEIPQELRPRRGDRW